MAKLCEEFSLYENMWDADELEEPMQVQSWKAPDGELVDISTSEARQAELIRYRELFFERFSKRYLNSKIYLAAIQRAGEKPEEAIEAEFEKYSNRVLSLLNQINICMEAIYTTKQACEEENKAIINKLTTYSSLRKIVDLKVLLNELNTREAKHKNQKSIDELSSLNAELRKYYFRA